MKPLLLLPVFLWLLFFSPKFLLLFFAIYISSVIYNEYQYRKSSYYQIAKLPFFLVRHDLGKYGEYLIYRNLRQFEEDGAKFLFNVYVPKDDGGFSEIDVLMICPKGLFVFESKNYSGWIFGNETQKNWYQTLPVGKGRKSQKEVFYNPILQNKAHIKHLRTFLEKEIPAHSVIVFSERCTLKNVETNTLVIHRNEVSNAVTHTCREVDICLSENEILEIYNKLYPYTQLDEKTKALHIAQINGEDIPSEHENIPNATPSTTKESSSPLSNPCPRCGGMLVVRTANRGANAGKQFYGCSNYPKCRYIKNIAE